MVQGILLVLNMMPLQTLLQTAHPSPRKYTCVRMYTTPRSCSPWEARMAPTVSRTTKRLLIWPTSSGVLMDHTQASGLDLVLWMQRMLVIQRTVLFVTVWMGSTSTLKHSLVFPTFGAPRPRILNVSTDFESTSKKTLQNNT